ncbi:MAG: molybdopterin cofactor-binding domain-containing protein, partial [Thiolinea sp.]
ALIAEELDVDLDAIQVDPGPPSAAYWNTALAEEMADFMVPSAGFVQDATEDVVAAAMKFIGLQITGGSTTVPDGYLKLRAAGATARETLKAAAAQQLGVPVSQLSTANGAVIAPDGQQLSYTVLAPLAAQLEPVADAPLRDPSQWRYLGKPMRRVDIIGKSTGTLDYGIDVNIPGMVHAAVVLNPHQGGAMNSFDAAEAEKMRGVKAVIPITGGAAVVADNTWRAQQAAQKIRFDWGPAPFPARMEAHWSTLADSFNAEHLDSRQRDDGDVDAALQDAQVIEAEYRAPYLAHAPLEPINAVVRVDDDGAEVWTGTQIPRFVQNNVGKIIGVDAEQVKVHVRYMGGSFGHRLEDEVVRRAAEIALAMKGTPVKLTYKREQDMTHDFVRQVAMARMRGAVRDGKVEVYDLGIAMPSITASQLGRQVGAPPGPDNQIVAGAWEQRFAIPHHRVSGYRAPPLAPISSWRSVGASTNGFFYNAGLDELIAAAGADPLEERLRLCNDVLTRKVLEAVGEMSGWNGPHIGPQRGRGIALTQSFGVPCAEVIEVTHTDQGIRIDKVYVAVEVGTVIDPVNFENQVQGGVVWGLGHAMNCEITYTDGVADQNNFHVFQGMRLRQCPEIVVRGLENGDKVRGVGEPPVPPAAPALAAAIYAATGQRLREMPFSRSVKFV